MKMMLQTLYWTQARYHYMMFICTTVLVGTNLINRDEQ